MYYLDLKSVDGRIELVPSKEEGGRAASALITLLRSDLESWSNLPSKEQVESSLKSIGSIIDRFAYALLMPAQAEMRAALTETILKGNFDDPRRTERSAYEKMLEGEFQKSEGFNNLYLQIKAAVAYENARSGQPENTELKSLAAIQGLARDLTVIILKLAEDVEAAYQGDPAAKGTEEIITTYPGYAVNRTYRIANTLYRLGVPYVPRMMTEYAHGAYGADIHPGASIGRRFFIDHVTKVVIGETAVIGNDVKLYHGVTLGAVSLSDSEGLRQSGAKRHPTLGNGVVVYSDATILGGDTHIGDHSTIGAGARLVNMRTGEKTEFGANATGFGSTIGNGSRIKSNTTISYSSIGDRNDIGPNATVINARTEAHVKIEANAGVHGKRDKPLVIGHNAHIGENMAVTHDVASGTALHV